MKPVLLGEAPSKGGDRYHHFPLSGRPARVLCEAAGIPPQPEGSTYGRWTWALYEEFDCRNLIDRYAQASPWRVPYARERAAELLADLKAEALAQADKIAEEVQAPPVVLVCLGRKVQAAIGDALDFRSVRLRSRTNDGWGADWAGGLFGNYGTWAAPWHIRTPIAGQPPEWAPWLVTIPHPSGLNRLLNDPNVRDRLGQVLREARDLAAGAGTLPAR